MSIEKNIRKAFQGVKKDILEIKDQLLRIAERQERLESTFEESKKKVKNNEEYVEDLVQIRDTGKKKSKKPAKKTSRKTSRENKY